MTAPHLALETVAASRILWSAAAALPSFFPGRLIHQAALRAHSSRRYAAAERLFEAAARRYREETRVVELARLRVHQLIARVSALEPERRAAPLYLEVERRLARLERIESVTPPFALVEASSLLAHWTERVAPAATAAPRAA